MTQNYSQQPWGLNHLPGMVASHRRISHKHKDSQVKLNTILCFVFFSSLCIAQDAPTTSKISLAGPEWISLGSDDFVNVNCEESTWSFPNGEIHCTGKPVGVMRTKRQYTNLEVSVEWRHLKAAGNSGVFLWASEANLATLKPGGLPEGIEVQILDHGYADNYRQRRGKEPDWFTTNGDVFPTGKAKMTPFAPVAPNGRRSFPSRNVSKGTPEWNHYYIRAINGEVRLWVNGEEVSGGTDCSPASGFLCLESEGSPIEFRNLKVRELP